MKLTEKQKAFCDYYIETLNATESYKKAGYKVKTDGAARVNASRLLTNANVRKYIEERMKQKESERIASQDEVLEFLTRVMRGQEVEEVVGFTEYGAVKEKKAPSTRDRVKAAELLGKRYMLFSDNVNLTGNVGVQIIDDIIDDSFIRQIMTLRYIHGYSWRKVAHHMGGGNTSDSVRKACIRYLASH